MKTSKAGILAILDHEAVVLTPYKDSVDVWTVAVGHTKSAGAPDPRHVDRLNLEEALHIFETDLAKFEARVNKWATAPLEQHEFDALVSFDFNTGGIRYRNRSKKWVCASLVNSLNAGDPKKAAAQFMNWKKPPEIIGRRKKEQALFRGGKYPNITKLKVYDRYPGKMRLVSVPERYLKDDTSPPAPVPPPPDMPTPPKPKLAPVRPSRGFWAWLFGLFK